jgi:hypothetical protein
MRYLLIFLVPSIITLANPIYESYITEIQVAPDSLERIEIYNPNDFAQDLSNSQIITSAGIAFVNDSTFIPAEGYFVIDSTNTHGVFSLNDESDSIFLYGYYSVIEETYKYPVLPAGYGHGPTPPYNGSVALFTQYIGDPYNYSNWYIDSTPTFGSDNNDWSSISGMVLDQDSNPAVFHEISASGPMGGLNYYPHNIQPYSLRGLGVGKYWVQARLGYNWYSYPESIDLGYNEHLTGYDIIFPFVAIQDKIGKAKAIPIIMKDYIYDALGRKIISTTKYSKGVYFTKTETGIKKFVIAH